MDNSALFVNIVPWRPHGDHSAFVAEAMKREGWQVNAVICAGGLEHCYQKLVNRRKLECLRCKFGSLDAYAAFEKVDSIRFGGDKNIVSEGESSAGIPAVSSSIGAAYRVELDTDLDNRDDLEGLLEKTKKEYRKEVNTWVAYLQRTKPSLVFLFNARFHNAGAVLEACRREKITCLTHERSWFGYGIQVNKNEDCISLSTIVKKVKNYSEVMLNKEQARKALSLVDSRLKGTNSGEWRAYGQVDSGHKNVWPSIKPGKKILVIPSSRSEFIGHADYALEFETSIQCLTYFLETHSLLDANIVIRSHPAWALPIGVHTTSDSLSAYEELAAAYGLTIVSPESKLSTYALMREADFAIFNGGSAVVEAGIIGCPSVLLSPSPYQEANLALDCTSKAKIEASELVFLDHRELFKRALRYVYTRIYRLPYFINGIQPISGKSCEFFYQKQYIRDELAKMLVNDAIDIQCELKSRQQDEDDVFDAYIKGEFKSVGTAETAGVEYSVRKKSLSLRLYRALFC